jgi:hypothetical protein
MPRGGKREGSGRKPKALADKILEGNPGKRPLKVLSFENGADASDFPAAFENTDVIDLPDDENELISVPGAKTIYNRVNCWLKRTGCAELISPLLVEKYSVLYARWLECEAKNTENGLTGFNKHGECPSPYVEIGITYQKQAAAVWTQIWTVVAANSSKDLKKAGSKGDTMNSILS